MSRISNQSRRSFLTTSAASASLLAFTSVSQASADANSTLRIGFIGVGDVGHGGGRCQAHIDNAMRIQNETGAVEVAAVCDVFNRYLDATVAKVENGVGKTPFATNDYREIINSPKIDAVVISTPDHWHARQTIDALKAGKHVYCEKPMTHSVDEALEVLKAWKESGLVMQVGVQSTSLPVWNSINQNIRAGEIGKVMQYQTEYFRNSDMGQWRYYDLAADMTPKNIDWKMFLGTEFDLAPDMPFDRAKFAQWRCYWDFGSGMYTDLFVHRTTSMLKATGLRFPRRVVGAGGIFLEYDGRTVPDVATVAADFSEGVQGLVTATMCSCNTPIKQVIRGHHASIVLGTGEKFSGYDYVAERSPVTHDSSIVNKRVEVGTVDNTSYAHFKNFVESVQKDEPEAVNCSPELGAAAMTVVKLGTRSYREDKVFYFDDQDFSISEGDGSWAKSWEQKSEERAKPNHVQGWHAGDKGSLLLPKDYQSLAGPWMDGKDPASKS